MKTPARLISIAACCLPLFRLAAEAGDKPEIPKIDSVAPLEPQPHEADPSTIWYDFRNLKWLGNKPVSRFKLHSREESGRWVCVESRARLNTPGRKDGLNQLWIDGRLEAERRDLDWRGTYTGHGINAVFLEAYWNKGSPVDQSRWIDNFVISTKPIGTVVCPRSPVLLKTPYRGPGKQKAWEAEIAADDTGEAIVWRSTQLSVPDRVKVGEDTGRFVGPLSGAKQLGSSQTHFLRVRQQSDTGQWSAWSGWHQPFRTPKGRARNGLVALGNSACSAVTAVTSVSICSPYDRTLTPHPVLRLPGECTGLAVFHRARVANFGALSGRPHAAALTRPATLSHRVK